MSLNLMRGERYCDEGRHVVELGCVVATRPDPKSGRPKSVCCRCLNRAIKVPMAKKGTSASDFRFSIADCRMRGGG